MKVLGIDEAGRGAVIGPMVICGFLIDKEKVKLLRKFGVRDSKELSPEKREEIAKKLKKLADDYILLKFKARDIDESRSEKSLNEIEFEAFAKIIKLLSPDIAIIDSPQFDSKKVRKKLRRLLGNSKVRLIVRTKADKRYAVVSAASILAKVKRDEEIERLKRKFGFDFGTGYAHDERTLKFLQASLRRHELPACVRRSWITVKRLVNESRQRKLLEFAS